MLVTGLLVGGGLGGFGWRRLDGGDALISLSTLPIYILFFGSSLEKTQRPGWLLHLSLEPIADFELFQRTGFCDPQSYPSA